MLLTLLPYKLILMFRLEQALAVTDSTQSLKIALQDPNFRFNMWESRINIGAF